MFGLLVALSFFVHEKTVSQDSMLMDIRTKPDTVKVRLYRDAGEKSFANPQRADSLGLLTFQWAKRTADADNQGRGAFIISFANRNRNLPRALAWADSAVYYFEKAKNYQWAGYVTRVVGVDLSNNKNSLASVEYLQRSSNYFLKSNDSLLIAQNFISLSLLYHNNLQDYKLGLQYGLDAVKFLSQLKTVSPAIYWLANNAVAINYDDTRQYDKALEYHFKNLSLANASQDNLAATNNNIGNTYRKKKTFAIAEPYFVRSLELNLLNPDDYQLATVYNNLSNINADMGRLAKARMYRDSAIHYSLRSNNTEKLLDTYFDSYTMSERNGDFKDALKYLKHYTEIKDTSLTAEKARIAYAVEAKYESERKQQHIALLESEAKVKDLELDRFRIIFMGVVGGFVLLTGIVYLFYKQSRNKQRLASAREREELQRQRYAAVLEAEENERSRVAKELHDGLGQLLSTIKLSLSAIDEPGSGETARLLKNSLGIVDEATQEVRAISHNLMPATLVQIGLAAALRDVCAKINESALLQVNLTVEGLENRLPVQTEITVYRIIQEVLNNMIKHSKANVVTITVARSVDGLRLLISDNGIGFEKEIIGKSAGLGWKNIFTRVSMLNGKIEVDTQPGSGTSVSIKLAV